MSMLIKPRAPILIPGHPIARGLVFDSEIAERGGTVIRDQGRYRTNGVANSGVTFVRGKWGEAAKFDGSTGKIDITTVTGQNSLTAETIEVIYRRDGTNATGFLRLLHKGPNANGYIDLNINTNNGALIFQHQWSPQIADYAMTEPTSGLDHHLIGTYDGSSTSNAPVMWVDSINTAWNVNATLPSGTRSSDNTALAIGGRTLDTARAFNGLIYLVRIWNRVLTNAEIKQLFRNPWIINRRSIIQRVSRGFFYFPTA